MDAGASIDASVDSPAPALDAVDDAAPPSPRPVAPYSEPAPLQPAQWYFVSVADPRADPVMAQIDDGSFQVPPGDGVFRGVDWVAFTPADNGNLRASPRPLFYATADLGIPAGTRVIARADTVASLHLGTQRQPGDVYAFHNRRVPLVVADDAAFVARCLGQRTTPQVELWTTPDELWMNVGDVTAPDLRVGDGDPQWLGVPVLELTDAPALDVTARVVDNDYFSETTVAYPALAARAVTQVAFELRPKAPFAAATDALPVRVRIESDSLRWSYEREVMLHVVAPGGPYKRTFRSAIDGSAQYYAVLPPPTVDPMRDYSLVLSLHGAGVEAIGQAGSYSPKDWAYVVAATNRRPFGFDWEAWGRLDALEVLEQAKHTFRIDPTRVYLTGHSMGGHGTWQVGTLFPGRFAVVAPSAGWSSFYTYTGAARPSGAFARSEASSDTNAYVTNLARRAVYVLHGDADDNVPVREARDMVALLTPIVPDLTYHEQPGAGHWWDGDAAVGVDCVDWPDIFALMQARTLDPSELDFDFLSPSVYVSPSHSFVTIRAPVAALGDVHVVSAHTGDQVTLTTANVRGMVLDGDALLARGVARVVVDGAAPVSVVAGPMPIGPQDGKRPGASGPFAEVLSEPFCLAYPDDGPRVYADYAAFLVSSWAVNGNGHGCALPVSRVTDAVRASRRVVYLGVDPRTTTWAHAVPFAFDGTTITVGATSYSDVALAFVFPEGDGSHLGGGIVATPGSEYLLFRVQPFTSGFALPDYLVWASAGARAAGFFDASWTLP